MYPRPKLYIFKSSTCSCYTSGNKKKNRDYTTNNLRFTIIPKVYEKCKQKYKLKPLYFLLSNHCLQSRCLSSRNRRFLQPMSFLVLQNIRQDLIPCNPKLPRIYRLHHRYLNRYYLESNPTSRLRALHHR